MDQTAADLEARAHLLETQMGQGAFIYQPAAVDAFCKEAGKRSATRITVILPSGVVIGDSREIPRHMDNHASRPEIADALNGVMGTSLRYSDTLHQRMMYVAIPFFEGNQIVAVIRTSLPLTALDEALADIRIRITLGVFLIAIIAAIVSLLISRQYSRPLEEMKEGAARYARGELEHRLTLPDSEEIAGLAEAMNSMAEQLSNRIDTIRSQRRELETVLSSMLEGLVAIDNEERIISINQAAASWFEVENETAQGRNLQEIIRNQALQKFVTDALQNGEPMEGDVTAFQNGERVLNVKSSPLLDAAHKRIGTLIVFNDVTQLRRLENMRRDFVANVSHEIKTPLTAIKGFVETLHHGNVDDPSETKRFLGIVLKHVDRLNSIIEDLLSLSRIEQESEDAWATSQEKPLRGVFRAALQICRPKAEQKNITITIKCADDLQARFDPILLEQAVVNLLDNAIKYSESGSTITVDARAEDDSGVMIQIQDQGIGIAKKHLSRLFERFYRVDKARSRNLGGTGLGLAIVKHIAQAHHGHVSVKSKLGEGSTFTIHLPKIK
jgi:two-component system phosphate regulon sensor histidine kinase PhoR